MGDDLLSTGKILINRRLEIDDLSSEPPRRYRLHLELYHNKFGLGSEASFDASTSFPTISRLNQPQCLLSRLDLRVHNVSAMLITTFETFAIRMCRYQCLRLRPPTRRFSAASTRHQEREAVPLAFDLYTPRPGQSSVSSSPPQTTSNINPSMISTENNSASIMQSEHPSEPAKAQQPIIFLHGLFGSKKNNRTVSK